MDKLVVKSTPQKTKARRRRGFERAGVLVADEVRLAAEDRGFTSSRVLTHWEEIAGPDLSAATRPVKVSYGRDGIGATLTVLTTGSFAPVLQAELERLKGRVNACYGYAAVSKIRITQTAPSGFAEAQAQFSGKTQEPSPRVQSNRHRKEARAASSSVTDQGLREALETLGANILERKTR
ncbi:MAG: DciA family protein [Pseudomonadota bacterium]